MHLPVIQTGTQSRPWYADGLRFTCTQCGNCCTGGPGHVWISREEIQRMAAQLTLTVRQVIARYCRRVGGRYSLKERRNQHGEYDCVFLRDERVPHPDDPRVCYTRRICTVYPVRPLQCRTWPFWDGNLASEAAWNRAARRCHGVNNGTRVFTQKQIDALRDAKDWPTHPPTSS